MIDITITRNENRMIIAFTISGHAFFANSGKDIVCAGVSAVSFGTVNAIEALTGVVPKTNQGKNGFLHCDFQEFDNRDVQLLLEAMVVSLKTIELDYGKYIKIKSGGE